MEKIIFAGTTLLRKQNTMESKRFVWIDWMKALGMYFIVAGHFFSIYHKYIYIFSVPVFFLISGFLTKREQSNSLFWRKLGYNLFIPMIIVCGTIYVIHLAAMSTGGLYFFDYIYKYPLGIIRGDTVALGRCWFIYTLIIVKILYQYIPGKAYPIVLISVCLLYVSYFMNIHSFFISDTDSNAIVNVCLAFPFFLFGIYFRSYKKYLDKHYGLFMEWLIFLLSILTVVLCGKFNGYVWMYKNVYGESLALFLIGGLAGSCALFILCKWLTRRFGDCRIISVISKGSIIILGFHYFLIDLLPHPEQMSMLSAIMDYMGALVIVLLFVPVIRFCETHLPYLIGKYRLLGK